MKEASKDWPPWQARILEAACPGNPETDVELFRCEWGFGLIARAHRPSDLEAGIRRVIDPGRALRTLHWGRNYLYVAELETANGPLTVVVKQFRHLHLKERWLRTRRGSKAALSFRAARALMRAGIGTPEPVMLVESARVSGPSFFIAQYLDNAVEARAVLAPVRAFHAGDTIPAVFLTKAAALCRHMHDNGFWHRDLSSGNILEMATQNEGSNRGAPAGFGPAPLIQAGVAGNEVSRGPSGFYVTDLNRMRIGRHMGFLRRMRDVGRLEIRDRRALDIFLTGYWEGTGKPLAAMRALYRIFSFAFTAKIEARKPIKRAWESISSWFVPPGRGAHLMLEPSSPGRAEMTVWDPLRCEPDLRLSPARKIGMTLAHPGDLVVYVRTVGAAAFAAARSYRALRRDLDRNPITPGEIGVGVLPRAEQIETVLAAVDDLGIRKVLLRLHAWERDHACAETLASELRRRGIDLTFSIVQSREVVADLGRWRSILEEIDERFRPYGANFQIGHAINRFKWGIWSLREYRNMAEIACEVLRRRPGSIVAGPAVIDFEYHVTAAVLNVPGGHFYFDVVTALLYVDRRGAPENRQFGFNAQAKAVLLRALAETAANAAPRCWITEVNWALPEGPHATAGSDVVVSEDDQARFLSRYFLLTLGTGLIERAYWWELVARGCGLIDPSGGSTPRQRPAYRALRTLAQFLRGSTLVSAQVTRPNGYPGAGAFQYRFRRDETEFLVIWSPRGEQFVRLPRPAARVIGLEGEERDVPDDAALQAAPSPQYVILAPG